MEEKASSRCIRCHKALKNPKSITQGMGPVCWAKTQREREAEEEQGTLPLLPFNGDIVCKRDPSGEPQFNIPQRIKLHSPTGMEWGYGGSGPADFALNILALFTDEKTAYDLHQAFKWDFIAKLPIAGGVIKRADILAWLADRGVKVVA